MLTDQLTVRQNVERGRAHFSLEANHAFARLDDEYNQLLEKFSLLNEQSTLLAQRCDVRAQERNSLRTKAKDLLQIETELREQIHELERIQSEEADSAEDECPGIQNEIIRFKRENAQIDELISITSNSLTEMESKCGKIRFDIEAERQRANAIEQRTRRIASKRGPRNENDEQENRIRRLVTRLRSATRSSKEISEFISKVRDLTRFKGVQLKQIQKERNRIYLETVNLGKIVTVVIEKGKKLRRLKQKKIETKTRLSEVSRKLSESYQAESKQNGILPTLIKTSCDLDQADETLTRFEQKFVRHEQQESDRSLRYQETLSQLNFEFTELELRLKFARREDQELRLLSSTYCSPTASSQRSPAREERRLQRRIDREKQVIRKLQTAIDIQRKEQDRLRICQCALVNQARQKSDAIQKLSIVKPAIPDPQALKQSINFLELRLDAKRQILDEQHQYFLRQSSMLICVICNVPRVSELLSTFAMSCDPMAKLLVTTIPNRESIEFHRRFVEEEFRLCFGT
jgi:hypothetical protein